MDNIDERYFYRGEAAHEESRERTLLPPQVKWLASGLVGMTVGVTLIATGESAIGGPILGASAGLAAASLAKREK